jgi:hypothetical protein
MAKWSLMLIQMHTHNTPHDCCNNSPPTNGSGCVCVCICREQQQQPRSACDLFIHKQGKMNVKEHCFRFIHR